MDKQLKAKLTKWIAILLTIAILVAIYSQIRFNDLVTVVANIHPWYFALALSIFIPQFLVTALRWRIMMAGLYKMSMWSAFRMVMAGKALNAIAPSKMGEMSKAIFLKREGATDLAPALTAVVLEKVLDVGGLCVVLLMGALFWRDPGNYVWWSAMLISVGFVVAAAGVLLIPLQPFGKLLLRISPKLANVTKLFDAWDLVLSHWKSSVWQFLAIIGLSILLWSVHVLQIYLFFPSLFLGHTPPIALPPAAFIVANIPLAIFVGLLPIAMAGMGTRDAAFIYLFGGFSASFLPVVDPALTGAAAQEAARQLLVATMAGVGLLCSMRYWVDTVVGIPFFHMYASKANANAEPPTQRPG